MKFTVRLFDVRDYLARGERPFAHVELDKTAGDYWAVAGDVFGACEFAKTAGATSDAVRIPMTAYRTGRDGSAVFGLGVQIGLAAASRLRHYTADPPREVILLLGSECTDLPAENAVRCYVGVAFRVG